MNDFLALAAQSSPGRPALIAADGTVTYADLNTQVAKVCARLEARGVKRSDRVAVLLDRSHQAVQLVHALARLGAVIVPLNTRLTPVEMGAQIEDAACQWTFSTLKEKSLKGAIRLEDLKAASNHARWLSGALNLDDDFGILFTSGTTGRPKGAVLTWGNVFWSATASAFRLGVLPGDRWLLTMPLFHIGGLSILFRSALYGTAVVLPDFPADQFDLACMWKRMHESRITLVSLVPTMLYRLLKEYPSKTDWPASLRLILLGGAAASPEILSRGLAMNLAIAVTYGLSEAASQVATAPPDLTHRKPGSVGRPLQWTHLRVVDDLGNECPPHDIGEIQVSGPTIMRGYLKYLVLQDGWLKTGDLGYLDDDGDLWMVQRRTDLIISGGENIYPAEIEAVLRQHPSVEASCVVGIPHPEWGQQVAAGVVLNSKNNLTPRAVEAFCREHLAGFKVPRHIMLLESLPKTASGKVNRDLVKQWIQQ
jgi:O-succinylbenzoic acid--CoA ligase